METNCVSDGVDVDKMSKVQILRSLVEQRLTAAAVEIFGVFEKTIAEYEEELCRTKEENERKQQLLDTVLKPQVLIHRADVHQLLMVKDEVPSEQQDRSPTLDQNQEAPEPPHIVKQEQEELWTNREGEQLKDLMQPRPGSGCPADVHQLLVVKEEVPAEQQDFIHTFSLAQEDTEPPHIEGVQVELWTNHELRDGVGSELASSFPPNVQTHTEYMTQMASGTEVSDEDRTEKVEPPADLNSQRNNTVTIIRALSERWFSCSECSARFRQKYALKIHMRKHTGEKPYSCSICGKTFSQKGNSISHMKCHTVEKPLSCSFCNRSFQFRGAWSQHMKSHTRKKMRGRKEGHMEHRNLDGPLQPETSASGAQSKATASWKESRKPENVQKNLSLNDMSHKNGKESFYERGQRCGQKSQHVKTRTEKKTNLNMSGDIHKGSKRLQNSDPDGHLQTKSKNRPSRAKSEVGGEGRERNRELELQSNTSDNRSQNNRRSRSVKKSFPCSECGHIFRRQPHLKIHMRIHTGEKPYSCSICGQRFSQKGNSITHMRRHTGETPFSCSICRRSFPQKGNLISHMRCHTGEKPFSCSVCIKSFRYRGDLNRHMKNKHRGEKLVNDE